MTFPINKSKFDNENDENALIYTLDNLAYRGVQSFMTNAAWGDAWILESFANMAENGSSVGDMIDTGVFPISFFKTAYDGMARRGIIPSGLQEKLFTIDKNDGRNLINENEFDGLIRNGDVISRAKEISLNDIKGSSKHYEYLEYWAEMRGICMYAGKNHGALGKAIKHVQEQRPYEKGLAEIFNALLKPLNNYYLYLYGIYQHQHGFLIAHCCCLDGNEIIEIHQNGKVLIPERGQELKVNPIIIKMIADGSNQEGGYPIANSLRMPFDIGDMVTDYDVVVAKYTSAS